MSGVIYKGTLATKHYFLPSFGIVEDDFFRKKKQARNCNTWL